MAIPTSDHDLEAASERIFGLLQAGCYSEGWPLFEARKSRTDAPFLRCGVPEWQGEPLVGRRLLVVGEQGIGDEVQFGRFIPRLKQLGASIVASVLPMNIRLFEQLGCDLVMDRLQANSFSADYVVGLMSLPLRLGCFTEAAFGGEPYLKVEKQQMRHGIGVVWRGQPRHPNDLNRSMPGPDLLTSLPDALFIEPQGDTMDSLVALSGLQALVTVDTSWAHLGGAGGIETHVMLPYVAPDWRWGLNRPDTPWYTSVTLHRQTAPGDWGSVLASVRTAMNL